jgi:hypothetical protein
MPAGAERLLDVSLDRKAETASLLVLLAADAGGKIAAGARAAARTRLLTAAWRATSPHDGRLGIENERVATDTALLGKELNAHGCSSSAALRGR